MLKNISIAKGKQNKWEQLFEELLSTVEFSLIRYGRGYYGLSDNQGANLGGIEECVFTNAREVIDRLDAYIHDYIIEDIEEELKNCRMNCPTVEQILNGDKPFTIMDCEYYYRLLTLLPQSDKKHGSKFVKEHKFEYDLLDMILHHFEEINLQNISCIITNKHVRIVSVTETFSKNFMVIASSKEEATEIVGNSWNEGSLGDFNGDDYLPDSYICDDITEEYGDWPTDDLTLVNENEKYED